MTEEKVNAAKKLLKGGVSPKEIAKTLGVSVPTLYRWCPASEQVRVQILAQGRTVKGGDREVATML